jgi:hypothetical protein
MEYSTNTNEGVDNASIHERCVKMRLLMSIILPLFLGTLATNLNAFLNKLSYKAKAPATEFRSYSSVKANLVQFRFNQIQDKYKSS